MASYEPDMNVLRLEELRQSVRIELRPIWHSVIADLRPQHTRIRHCEQAVTSAVLPKGM